MKIFYIALMISVLLMPSVNAQYAPWNWTSFPEANFSSVGNYTSMFEYVNVITNSYFGPTLVLMIFAIVFMTMGVVDIKRSALVAGHISFVMTLVLWIAGIVPEFFLMLMAIMTVAITLFSIITRLR